MNITGLHSGDPLQTLDWPESQGEKPKSWWGLNPQRKLTKVYRDYAAYCD